MAIASIAIAAAFLHDGWSLRPGAFEPVGPGSIPNATAWIAIALAAFVLVRSLASGRATGRDESAAADGGERWGEVLPLAGLTVAYVAAMGLGLLRYNIATAAYLLVAVLLLAEDRRGALPTASALAAILGFGLDYVFRHVLVTDLP